MTRSRQKKKEQAVWQRRFWEHEIQNENDFNQHVDYIHYNPVKHGHAESPAEWSYSSFQRYVERNLYELTWGAEKKITFGRTTGHEYGVLQ